MATMLLRLLSFFMLYSCINSQLASSTVKADREGGMPIDINVTELDKSGFFAKQDQGFNKFVAPCLFSYFPSPLSGDKGPSTSGSIQKVIAQLYLLISVIL